MKAQGIQLVGGGTAAAQAWGMRALAFLVTLAAGSALACNGPPGNHPLGGLFVGLLVLVVTQPLLVLVGAIGLTAFAMVVFGRTPARR